MHVHNMHTHTHTHTMHGGTHTPCRYAHTNPPPPTHTHTHTVPSFFDRHINSIVQLLHMNEISPHLTELKILTAEETTILLEMRSQRTRKIVVEELVNMLKAKGMDGLRKFMTALEQTTDGTGHGDLLKRFREDPDYEQINRFS